VYRHPFELKRAGDEDAAGWPTCFVKRGGLEAPRGYCRPGPTPTRADAGSRGAAFAVVDLSEVTDHYLR
jgi:hypothetical protein